MGIELIILVLNDDMDVGDFISPCSCNHLDNFGHIPLRFGHLYWIRGPAMLVISGWWLGTFFSPDIGNVIIPTHPN
jgi:hypothetical protein